MKQKTLAPLVLAVALWAALAGCTNVTQMHQAYQAGDHTQLARLLEIAGRPTYPYATRKQAVTALGDIGSPEAVPVLLSILREYDRRTSLKEESVVALGKIGDPETATPIGHLLDRSLTAPNEELRLAALNVLGHLGGEDSARILINALDYYDMLMVRADQGRLRGAFSGDESVIRAMRDSVRTPGGEQPKVGMFPSEGSSPTSFFGPEMDYMPEKVTDSTPQERAMAHEALVRVGAEAIPIIQEFQRSEKMTITLEEELAAIAQAIEDQAAP